METNDIERTTEKGNGTNTAIQKIKLQPKIDEENPKNKKTNINSRTKILRFSSCIWKLGCQVAIKFVGCDYATDAVPLYQYSGTQFADLRRMTD